MDDPQLPATTPAKNTSGYKHVLDENLNKNKYSSISVISREDAVQMGLVLYFTGKKCKFGHVSERYTISGGCKKCLVSRVKENVSRIRSIKHRVRVLALNESGKEGGLL